MLNINNNSSNLINCLDIIKNYQNHSLKLKSARSTSTSSDPKRNNFLKNWHTSRLKTIHSLNKTLNTYKQQQNQLFLNRLLNVKSTIPSHKIARTSSAQQLSMQYFTVKQLTPSNTLTHNRFQNWKKQQERISQDNYHHKNKIREAKSSYSILSLNKNSLKSTLLNSRSKQKFSSDWTMNYDTNLQPLTQEIKKNKVYSQKMKLMKKANFLYLKRLKQQQNITKKLLIHKNQTFLT